MQVVEERFPGELQTLRADPIRVAFVATGSTMTTSPGPGVQIPVAGVGAGD